MTGFLEGLVVEGATVGLFDLVGRKVGSAVGIAVGDLVGSQVGTKVGS